VVVLALLSAACTAEAKSSGSAQPAPFAGCGAITASPSAAAPAADLPNLSLPCFTGGEQVALAGVRGPAVINFWASWCGPCRTELPVMQRLADRASGRLTVLGVDTGDSRDAGASFAADKRVTMPTLVDADRKLFVALAGRTLPMTVFIDAQGRRFLYVLPLDEKTLPEQVRAHTGVTVTL
jgi:thiol-disulfide isomerase/thioredoxin